jgi:outer membrane protein assembly factor BamC
MLGRSFWLVIVLSALSGCSRFFPSLDEMVPDKRKEYQKAESLPDLEIPPDLSSDSIKDSMAVPEINQEGGAEYSTYHERVSRDAGERSADTSAAPALGDETAIVVSGTVAEIWPRLISFWRERGYAIDVDDQELGVIETAWREDRQALVRNKFKLFVERNETPSSSTLFLSHKGEHIDDNAAPTHERDERLETALAQELEAALQEVREDASVAQSHEGAAPSVDKAQLFDAGGNKLYLTLPEAFAAAWRDTGLALEHMPTITVEDQDRTRGVYYIRYAPSDSESSQRAERSPWSRLAFWKSDDGIEFQLSVTGVGPKTEVVVLDAAGRWDQSKTAAQILKLLRDELNKAAPIASTSSGA